MLGGPIKKPDAVFFKTQESVEEPAEVITTDDADGITCPKCGKGKLRFFWQQIDMTGYLNLIFQYF